MDKCCQFLEIRVALRNSCNYKLVSLLSAPRPASFELSAEMEHCFAIKMVHRQRQSRQNGAEAAMDSEDQQEGPRRAHLRGLRRK